MPRRQTLTNLKSILKAIVKIIAFRGRKRELATRLRAKWIYWFENPDVPPEVKALSLLATDKLLMRRYVASLGLRLPQIYADCGSVDEIDFARLPERVVIKPHNSWGAGGAMVIDCERELLSGAIVPRSALPNYCRETLASAKRAGGPPRIIVEEFVRDYDRRFVIPRDFKIYVAGGRAWVVQVIDRNGPKATWNQSFYSRDWAKFTDKFQTTYMPGLDVQWPPLLPSLISAAELMARDLGAFLRLDFYLTSDGPVFGEITWSPFDGIGFTHYGERYLCDLMDRFPDKIRTDLRISELRE
jgi:TupA-like ATPgrasp